MSIELLWIIPIVAAALLVLVLVLSLQKSENVIVDFDDRDLDREVFEFNTGQVGNPEAGTKKSETRLRKIEGTIQLVSEVLSNQQKIIEDHSGKDTNLGLELADIRNKLQELQEEYDITISENYSLRAKLRKIEFNHESLKDTTFMPEIKKHNRGNVLNGDILDDTRSFDSSKPSDLDDTSEINLSEINN